MKIINSLRHTFTCCFPSPTTISSPTPIITMKNRLSSSLTDLFRNQEPRQNHQEDQEDSLIDAAASLYHSHSPSHHRSTIVGTIYGRRRGHVTFCVQFDPATPPPFLFELSIPTHLLAKEMNSGILRIALECHQAPQRHAIINSLSSSSRRISPHVWKAYCNGRKVGYAVRRKPSDMDKMILQTIKSVSAGAGILFGDAESEENQEGELLYMRACYERVVGSRDSVSYHLVNPGGSPEAQELSVFLLRTG